MDEPAHADTAPRRTFLTRLSLFLAGLGAAVTAVPVVGFVLGPLLRRNPSAWRVLGPVSSYRIGETVEVVFEVSSPTSWSGVSDRTGAWLRRDDVEAFTAFSIHCTHLGCPVRWLGDAKLFMCPCHGGVYYADGEVAAGPPGQSLKRHPVRIRDGRVEVQTRPIPIT